MYRIAALLISVGFIRTGSMAKNYIDTSAVPKARLKVSLDLSCKNKCLRRCKYTSGCTAIRPRVIRAEGAESMQESRGRRLIVTRRDRRQGARRVAIEQGDVGVSSRLRLLICLLTRMIVLVQKTC